MVQFVSSAHLASNAPDRPSCAALPGWPLREHIRQAYQQLYGLTVDAAQIDRVLHLPLNQEAAGYERLR